MTPREKAVQILDNFITKASKQNAPFKKLQKTDEYSKFKSMFNEGIHDQFKWAVDNTEKMFNSAGIHDDLQPLTLDQVQKLKGIVSRDMPALKEYVSEFKIFQSLKFFYEFSAKAQYKKHGHLVKADQPTFELTSPQYIAQLKNRANYLLNKSALDETTLNDIMDMYESGRLDALTNDEVAMNLKDNFVEIDSYRAEMITRTESAQAMGQANHDVAVENGSPTHSWVVAGGGCPDCDENEAEGEIPIDEEFSTGDLHEPAHPNCECYTEAGELSWDNADLWSGE